jgi:hypothetical protein
MWTGRWAEVDSDGKRGSGKITLEFRENVFKGSATGTASNGDELEVDIVNKKK